MVHATYQKHSIAGRRNARTRIFFLAKFFSEEQHADQFMHGRLHANRLGYFKKLGSDSVRADAYEGVSLLRGDINLAATIDGLRTERITVPEHELAGPAEVRMDWTEHVNLLCMHAAHSGDYINIPDSSVDRFMREQIEIPEECLGFGEYAVVIKSFPKFVKRVRDAVTKTDNYRVVDRLVKYSDELSFEPTEVDTIFRKRQRYKSEREYRFAIFTGSDRCDPLILETSDLSDIAIRCNSAEINQRLRMSFQSSNGEVGRASGGGVGG